jgi:hypothetical protein
MGVMPFVIASRSMPRADPEGEAISGQLRTTIEIAASLRFSQ